jgi:hypothetical protein
MNTQEILEATEQLTEEQREVLINLLQKRHVGMRREHIMQQAKLATTACRVGQLTTETAEELIKRLHVSVQREE